MHEVTDPSAADDRPTILLVEEDDNARPPLKNTLRQLGYRVLLTVDEEDALEWVGSTYIPVDLVLINLVGKASGETLALGRRIRQHAKYDGHTPLVVIAEKYGKDLEGTDVNVEGHDWVTYLGEDADQLENLIARLLGR